MTQDAINQLWHSGNQVGNPFAIMGMGITLYENRYLKQDVSSAMQLFQRAASVNVLLARDLCQYISQCGARDSQLCDNAAISDDAFLQLEHCANANDLWALTILGLLLFRRAKQYTDREEALKYLKTAASRGILFAKDIVEECVTSPYHAQQVDMIPKPEQQIVQSNKVECNGYMQELNDLIGLSKVKEEVKSLRNYVLVQHKREEQGLPTPSVSYHCVFSGCPGTGKTTVARILAGIYKELGILKKGHLIECQRADLVGEYLGQTAPKTNAKIDEALDGILFIDEAYSLSENQSNDQYGREAIETLLKRMEDDRERLVVILAGYVDEMECFIQTNPGLQSRFNRYIHFEDYSVEELYKIFMSNVKKSQYKITLDASIRVCDIIANKVASKDAHFGNARYIRNLFEKVIQHQANRLANKTQLTKEDLVTIVESDIFE